MLFLNVETFFLMLFSISSMIFVLNQSIMHKTSATHHARGNMFECCDVVMLA